VTRCGGDAITIDGKALRDIYGKELPSVRLVAVYDVRAGLTCHLYSVYSQGYLGSRCPAERSKHPLLPLRNVSSEVEAVGLTGPDLLHLVCDTHCYRSVQVQAVDRGADPQTIAFEGDLERQPSEAHGEG